METLKLVDVGKGVMVESESTWIPMTNSATKQASHGKHIQVQPALHITINSMHRNFTCFCLFEH